MERPDTGMGAAGTWWTTGNVDAGLVWVVIQAIMLEWTISALQS